VDDAIVMLENIVRHMEMGDTRWRPPQGREANGFTILSMTISAGGGVQSDLFMGGILGRLFHEFAVTICSAILISCGVVDFDADVVQPVSQAATRRKARRFYNTMEGFFERMRALYQRQSRVGSANRFATLMVILQSWC